MIKNMKLTILAFFLSFVLIGSSKAESGYWFGGLKVFNYGIEKTDLQEINRSLIALGFDTSSSSTDNTGVGFDIGVGFDLTEATAFEVGYVDYGTLEINTTTTGPVENILTSIDGSGVTLAGVLRSGDKQNNAYIKAGMHSWEFQGTVTASLGSSTEPLGTGEGLYLSIGGAADGWYVSYDYYGIEDGSIGSFSFGYTAAF